MQGYFRKIVGVALAASVLVFSGCSGSEKDVDQKAADTGEKKISVYTSFYPMYDFTKKIGGDKIELTNLVPAGTEPHDWEPTPKDIARLEKADVLIYNGAGMEGWLDKVLETLNNKELVAVETSKEIKLLENPELHEKEGQGEENHEEAEDEGEAHSHDALEFDPHVWLNPKNAKIQMEAIKEALSKADPANKEFYENNYIENAKKLDSLDEEFKSSLSDLPKKDIVVAHQAFGYICNTYGLNQVAIEGLNPDSEPTPAKMAEITRFAKEKDVKYIFFEALISPKVAETIAKEVGAQTAVLNPLEGLDEKEIQAGKEYFTVMKENLEALKKALQ